MTIRATARPATARRVPPAPKDPAKQTLKAAETLIKTATRTGANDRNLLTAVRMLRNEIQYDPGNEKLWKLGVKAFDKNESWGPSGYHQAMGEAERLSNSGDKVGASRIYRALIVDYTEHAPIWRAAVKLFEPTAATGPKAWGAQ